MFKSFGSTREVFVNQDEGMFIALPITLDVNALTLETEVRNARTYVKAGSVVKEGEVVRGILAEEYDITYGPVQGRVVLEGYALGSRLTDAALAEVANLPKIIVLPYKAVFVTVKSIAEGIAILHVEGAKWSDDAEVADFTFIESDLTVNQLYKGLDGDLVIQFTGAGSAKISAISGDAFTGASGSALKGMPLVIEADGDFVVANVGSYNSGTGAWTNGGASYVFLKEGTYYTVAGEIPYEDADATLGLDAGNRIQFRLVNTAISAQADLPDGNIITIVGKNRTNVYTKAAAETDGSIINISNVYADAPLIIKVKWAEGEDEVVYTFDFASAAFRDAE